MGSFTLLASLLFLVILALVVGGFIWLIIYLSRRGSATSPHVPTTFGGSLHEGPDVRLRKLDALRKQGLINEVEYQQQRASIISSV